MTDNYLIQIINIFIRIKTYFSESDKQLFDALFSQTTDFQNTLLIHHHQLFVILEPPGNAM